MSHIRSSHSTKYYTVNNTKPTMSLLIRIVKRIFAYNLEFGKDFGLLYYSSHIHSDKVKAK